jgi:hypothetical protein
MFECDGAFQQGGEGTCCGAESHGGSGLFVVAE